LSSALNSRTKLWTRQHCIRSNQCGLVRSETII